MTGARTVRLALASVLCVSALRAAGCGTIMHGGTQNIDFASIPPGATIRLDTGKVYTTPSQIRLERKKDYLITISKDGYQPIVVPIESVPSAFLVGNAVFGLSAFLGAGVDVVSGGAWSLCPEAVAATLQPLAPGQRAVPVPEGPLSIDDKLKAIDRLHEQGILKDKDYEAIKKKLIRDRDNAKAWEETRNRDPNL